ncbi:MAG: DUF2341 domain-containing protein, partial [Nanoarchaeota archaeon]|nr:DUF2341 domain-containing protein [Nanoarchaeota archaeon]
YQVLLTVDTASLISEGKMQADCDDIRFTDSDETTELSYWLESDCNTANTKVWIKVPSLAASSTRTIYMYYGNAGASSASDGRNTFIVWDNFDGGTEQWTEVDANNLITIDRTSNKRIDFALAGQTNERVYIDKGSDIGNFLMDYKLHVTSDGNSNIVLAGVSDTLSWGSTFNDAIHGNVYTQRAGNQNKRPLEVWSDGTLLRSNQDENYEGQDLYFRLTRYGSECKGEIYSNADRTIVDASGAFSCTLTNLRYVYGITNWYNDAGYTSTMTGYVDDILIRKYTSTEPTYTIGSEEQNVAVGCTDNDGDGYGAEGTNLSQCNNSITLGDCNDSNVNIHPGAADIPNNNIDEDCSGTDNVVSFEIYPDFVGQSGVGTYYVGDDVDYQITFKVNNTASDEYLDDMKIELTDSSLNILKTKYLSDMTRQSPGVYTGTFISDDLTAYPSNQGIRLTAYAYDSLDNLLNSGIHADQYLFDGTAPSLISTAYTYL